MPRRPNPLFPILSLSALAPRCQRIARIAGIAGIALAPAIAVSQTAPDLHWRTITTQHFQVTFSPGLEDVARRAAGSGERAFASLSRELHPPRVPVSIVVADNLDTSNGYAVYFPTNRIVIFARPTVDANSLKFLDDWVDLVVTHELTHIFHLDRTRGLWRVGQAVFGRNPFLFPNAYTPSWLTEGIAVHYESKLTGAGRAVGTDFDAVNRAHDLAGDVPGANALSQASPLYPLGNLPYAYGTPLVEQVTGAAGPDAMRRFVDGTAIQPIPFLLNTNAKAAFGITFDSAYALWRDSVHRDDQRVASTVTGPTPIVAGGWFALRVRWADDHTLIWAAADPKSVPSLRQVSANGGPVQVVGVRNSSDVTSPLAGGWRVFAQQEYTDPYSQRTDLYVEHDGDVHRLTKGARITQPDARVCSPGGASAFTGDRPPSANYHGGPAGMPDVCIVAVQLLPGEARLVQVRASVAGVSVTPLTTASASDLWSEPRWSHDGTRVVATHWMRGGIGEIGVLDGTGRTMRTIGRSRAVIGSPAWGPGDTTIFFTSDRSGRSALYRANVARFANAASGANAANVAGIASGASGASGTLARIADSPTGLFENEPSPDGTRLATFVLRNDGYDLAVVNANVPGTPADSTSVLPPSRGTPLATSDAPIGPYVAWRSVLPRYWMPTLESGYSGASRIGLTTNGFDLVGRHSWLLDATQDTKRNEPEFDASYDFAGLGTPIISLGGAEQWDHPGVADSARTVLLPVARRKRFADAALTFVRRRYRTAASLSVGGSYEWRDFRALAEVPFSRFAPADRASLAQQYTYPSLFASAGFSNAREPYLALGPEDGVSASATVRQRWRTDAASATRATSVVGTLTAFRAFDFGGAIHHLLAVRVAAATEDVVSATEFDAGGGSGNLIQVVPGVTFGDSRRTFFVRGFAPESQTGSRAIGANAEYRFPIALPARGFGALPLFLQRISGVLFADGASAWCPVGSATSPICPRATAREWMGSVGAELHFDTAVEYDAPYRLRLGVAAPAAGRKYFGSSSVAGYVTVGLPF